MDQRKRGRKVGVPFLMDRVKKFESEVKGIGKRGKRVKGRGEKRGVGKTRLGGLSRCNQNWNGKRERKSRASKGV